MKYRLDYHGRTGLLYLKNGFAVDPIPFNSIYELTSDGQYIRNYRCYVDITPLNTALANNQ